MRLAKARLCFLMCFIICAACKHLTDESRSTNSNFDVKDFLALTNFPSTSNKALKNIDLEYDNAVNSGFLIPGNNQISGNHFICSFSIKNNSGISKKLLWKIYYKNTSYCFPETNATTKGINEFAEENFYGSYIDSTILFNSTVEIPSDGEYHEIIDSIRIAGNPRNEDYCYSNGINNRWRRNPRVGIYNFMLVVTDASGINKIPSYIQNISLRENNHFITPYYYFIDGDGKNIPNTVVLNAKDSLKVSARPDLGKGIYINNDFFNDEVIKNNANVGCGNDPKLFKTSAFSQFIHYIDKSAKLENIPVIDDVINNNYSKLDYNWNRNFYRKEELISTTPLTTKSPCETVYSDPVNRKIIIHNPKSTPGNWKKENVGIITRHGLTYGKVRVKVKLTQLLNMNNVWNGITNAIWLISQPNDKWNYRRSCPNGGYFKTYWGGPNDERINRSDYSEIDFEILKTTSYCPDINFPPVYRIPVSDSKNIEKWNTPLPEEILKEDGNITVACTNWDMACRQPENFGTGCNSISYLGKSFEAHRWDENYRAITEKRYAPDDELFGSPYYYFEIDWRPTEIIWRIGPEPDKMYIVGYMNEKITSIPNNQMLLIITQEFHNTKWWPGSPFQQENIPFPLNDINGEIYEIVIE